MNPVSPFGRSGNLAQDIKDKLDNPGVKKFLLKPHRQKELMKKVYAYIAAAKAGTGKKGGKGGGAKGSAVKVNLVIEDCSSPPAVD